MAAKKSTGPVRIRVQLSSVPYDMMRYDRACPATEQDSGKLERIAHGSERPEDRTVDFLCYALGAPTVGRWRSFNCKVLGTVANDWDPPKPVRE